jgi:hypothetical protein
MKSMKLQIFCGTLLAAMTAAGASHWWSVRQIVTAVRDGLPLPVVVPLQSTPDKQPVAPGQPAVARPDALAQHPARVNSPPDSGQKEFYESLIRRMESLQNQNRDLLDQLAETNRDLMKLEFRVDTHSESFRPLPVSEELREMSSGSDNSPGVLPPKAEPVEESLPILE